MEVCEKCGKRNKYYRSAFGSWKCYACGEETMNYQDRESGLCIELNNWWKHIPTQDKEEIKVTWEKRQLSNQSKRINNRL